MHRSILRRAADLAIAKLFARHDSLCEHPYRIDQLERRLLFDIIVNGTANADTISVSWNGSNVITVLNGSSSSHGVDAVTVNGLGGNDTITINSMPNRNLSVSAGDGNDTIFVGGGDFDAHISAFSFVDGDAGTDSVTIDDANDLGLDQYNLGPADLFSTGAHFTKTNNTINGLYIDTSENFTLQCNHASNTVIVDDDNTLGLNSISVHGNDGDDIGDFSNFDTTDSFFFDGGVNGTNAVKYTQDSRVGTSFTFTLGALDYGPNNLTWANTQNATITGTSSADTFNINVLAASTTLDVRGGPGNDTYNVGNGDIAGNIDGTLSLTDFNSFAEGTDKVFYNDAIDTGDDTYTVQNGSFNKTGLAHPIEAFLESYTLTANSGNNAITAIPANNVINTDWIIHGGAGDDDITFGNGRIDGLQGNVTLTGESGNDSLTINDSADLSGAFNDKDYSFAFGVIHYDVNNFHEYDITESNIETVSLDAGNFDNTFDLSLALGNETTLNLSGGDGDDTLQLAPFTTTATINFDGGTVTALDKVIVDDSSRPTATSYTLGRQSFDTTGFGLLTYTNTERVTLSGGAGADSVNLTGTAIGALTTVNCGGGDDTVTVGNNDLDTNIGGNLTVAGEGGADRIIFGDTGDALDDSYQLAGGIFRKGSMSTLVAYNTAETIEVNCNNGNNPFTISSAGSATSITARGAAGADSFTITPSATCTINIDASDPTVAPGDSLTMSNAGVAGHCTFVPNGPVNGTYTFQNALPVAFLGVETFSAVPAVPSQPDLRDADDTGISATDNITNKRTFTITGTAPPNIQVRIEAGTTPLNTVPTAADGSWSASVNFTTDGTFAITATSEVPATGLRSQASAPLNVTVDTVAPAAPPVAPDLDATSDNGASQSDNLTNDNTPLMTGARPANTVVHLFNGASEVGADTGLGSTYAIASSALSDGVRAMSTKFEDVAGNVSTAGPALNVTIDTVAPASLSSAILFNAPQQLNYTFNEILSPTTVTNADLVLQNLTTSTTVPTASISATPSNTLAMFTFPGFAGGVLPDGSYRGTVPAGAVQDMAGNGNAVDAVYNFIWSDGGAAPDTYKVATSTDGLTVQVFQNSATPTYTATRATLGAIGISALAGNDTVSVDLSTASPIPPNNLFVDGGGDIDTLAVLGTIGTETTTFAANSVLTTGGFIDRPNFEAMQFDGRGGLDTVNITGGPSVAFTASQRLQTLSIANGMAASVVAGSNSVLSMRNLTLTGTATLDLNDNDLILDYTGASPIATIRNLITTARAGGAWTGNGLTSSAARNSAAHNTTLGLLEATEFQSIYGTTALFDGEALDTTALLIKYTYYGDADFNGKVNFDDYVRTDNGFNNHQSGWLNGDFDLNGSVNFDDYVLIDLAFNTQNGTLRKGRP